MEHTPEQAAVVAAECGNLLVSAAAGSGKTAVLTDRIVSRIIDGELDIRGVLVMTFTEAAARSMKDKIEAKLRGALDNMTDPSRRHRLNRQISLLPGASISTIHAFCLNVIRNFYNCALDEQGQPLVEPDFTVDDGIEADILLRQTLDEYLGSQYERIDLANSGDQTADFSPERQAAFYRLMEGYGGSGGDQPVRELILRLYYYLRSLPDYPAKICSWLGSLHAAATSFSDSPHLRVLLKQLRLLLDRALGHLGELEGLLGSGICFIAQTDRNLAYRQQFAAIFAALRQLDRYLAAGGHDWDEIRSLTAGLANLELPRAGKADRPEKKAFMDLFCRQAAEVIFYLAGSCGTPKCSQHFIFNTRYTFCLPSIGIEADIAAQLPAVDLLFDLVLELDRQYARHKRTAGLIDFSDFEHLALGLLRQEEPRQYYRSCFSEVYVDEYQDTSSIQEEIIQAVSDSNCLAVGDIKQSIYRFRHARPTIFIERARSFQSGSANGILHELNRNFRSVEGILAAANDLFSQLMSVGAGEIDYDDRQALTAFRAGSPDCPCPVSLLLVNRLAAASAADQDDAPAGENGNIEEASSNNLSAADLNRHQQEALAVVVKMRFLHEQGAAWKDMVVLSRTRAIGQACRGQLESFGIPVQADPAAAFLETPVLRQMEALIYVLDNIRQDIPLAAVLRSEICQGGFTAQELVQIRLFARLQHPGMKFYHEAVIAFADAGPDLQLRHRLADALDWLDRLRENEQVLSLGELIGQIFAESGWLDRLAVHPEGAGQIRELRQFQQWAEQYETSRQRGLHAFASYIANMRERGTIDSPLNAAAIVEDAVRIITIHGSKGLEFPIVFLVGTGYDLTPKDSKDGLLISETLGIGMDFADPEQQIRYPTHLKLAMLEDLKAAGLAEELRLLYVAMTRAMDQLFIVGSVKISPVKSENRLAGLVRQAKELTPRQLPDYLVLSGKSCLEWLMLALARQPGLDLGWLEGGEFPAGELITPVWRLELLQLDTLQRQAACWQMTGQPQLQAPAAPAADPAALLEIIIGQPADPRKLNGRDAAARQRITAPYRFEQAARTPIKLTVSELKRQGQTAADPLEGENGQLLDPNQAGRSGWARGINLTLYDGSAADDPAESCQLDANQLGTLLHAFFRYLDLPAALAQPDLAEIRRQLAAMRLAGIFNEIETAALAAFENHFLDFIRSDLAAAMVRAAARPNRQLHEEMPFTLVLPACDVYADCAGLAPDDKVLVQGIIDCWFEQENGIILVDYKSDHLPAEPLLCQSELKKRYHLQMDYYARAIQAATGKTVISRLIWLIRQGRVVELTTGEAAP